MTGNRRHGPFGEVCRRVLVELTDEAHRRTRDVYGPLADSMTEFERYTDAGLRLIRDFLRMGSDLLIAQAARVQDLTRRRAGEQSGS
jgi:hypothetical protein